jgi:hypothetical protein
MARGTLLAVLVHLEGLGPQTTQLEKVYSINRGCAAFRLMVAIHANRAALGTLRYKSLIPACSRGRVFGKLISNAHRR